MSKAKVSNERICPASKDSIIMARRVEGYDIARTFAVFGMVIVNFKIVMGAEGGTTLVTVNR